MATFNDNFGYWLVDDSSIIDNLLVDTIVIVLAIIFSSSLQYLCNRIVKYWRDWIVGGRIYSNGSDDEHGSKAECFRFNQI